MLPVKIFTGRYLISVSLRALRYSFNGITVFIYILISIKCFPVNFTNLPYVQPGGSKRLRRMNDWSRSRLIPNKDIRETTGYIENRLQNLRVQGELEIKFDGNE